MLDSYLNDDIDNKEIKKGKKINKNEKENNIKSNIPKNNYKYKINNENNSIK